VKGVILSLNGQRQVNEIFKSLTIVRFFLGECCLFLI